MPLDLSAEDLTTVRSILRTHVPQAEVYAFGSRTTGRARPFSDLDLLIVDQVALPLPLRGDLLQAFSESRVPFRVDIVDGRSASSDFLASLGRNDANRVYP